jgi:hypothetical protein
MLISPVEGLNVFFRGNAGHGSRFIENTAAEKLVRSFLSKTCETAIEKFIFLQLISETVVEQAIEVQRR